MKNSLYFLFFVFLFQTWWSSSVTIKAAEECVSSPFSNACLDEDLALKTHGYLQSFGLSQQTAEELWNNLEQVVTDQEQLYPFYLAQKDPYFVALGVWRAHQDSSSLTLREKLSCTLTTSSHFIERTFQNGDLQSLRSLILVNPYFTTLNLCRCSITDSHLAVLGRIPHLKELLLEENQVTDDGVKIILFQLSLEKVNLSKNQITYEGAILLAKSPTIKYLCLYANPIVRPF